MPTLVILAAGVGSRYGGLKQLDTIGPNGENMMDYAIYDARSAGFDRLVFVIRRELEPLFSEMFTPSICGISDISFAFQSPGDLPEGMFVPEGRVKPWGTGHALYAARHNINGVFGVVGADDFFGRDAFRHLYSFLTTDVSPSLSCMVGYRLKNTLSESDSVSRGVCRVKDGMLQAVTERTQIVKTPNGGIEYKENGKSCSLDGETIVSMNVWGLHDSIVPLLESAFKDFLDSDGDPLKKEFYLPAFIDGLITHRRSSVKMIETDSQWLGVTYREDRDSVASALAKMHGQGIYPALR